MNIASKSGLLLALVMGSGCAALKVVSHGATGGELLLSGALVPSVMLARDAMLAHCPHSLLKSEREVTLSGGKAAIDLKYSCRESNTASRRELLSEAASFASLDPRPSALKVAR